ncbi:MAG: peptide deformylase [Christensenellaceae bacterium]|nr:peptide deformylase [Christensenellaceae bacterium]
MAIRKVLEIGDPKLREVAKEVKKFDIRLHKLLDDMAHTMQQKEGVGLAAPQVGILRRVAVIDINDGEGLRELINPVIMNEEGEQQGQEGCLSVPGRAGLVTRPQKLTVKAKDRHGKEFKLEAEGFLARAICHEYDHLNGRLYVDIMDRELTQEDLERMATEAKRRVYRRANTNNKNVDEGDNAVEDETHNE